jgi:hypothetical protein
LRQQGPSHASEQDFLRAGVAIGPDDQQVARSLQGMAENNLCDRNAWRVHLLDVNMCAMPSQMCCNVGTRFGTMSVAPRRIYDQDRHGLCRNEKVQ